MTPAEKSYDRPLDDLGYFLEWGGRSWERLFRYALEHFIGTDRLPGTDVLEVGARRGRVSALFALLGARVTALDLDGDALRIARQEAERFGVADRVSVVQYDGNLDAIADARFDVVFTKSVLVVVPDLDGFIQKLAAKLRPGGMVVFLENRRSNRLVQSLRRLKHRDWDCRRVNYFDRSEVDCVGRHVDIDEVRVNRFPPIYLILGRKRS